ncbi:hypothetical protein GSF67_08640 [Agrobacterium sp. CGMCC 11546]|nr:hypothetical protein GSF67_08640 [Agrobacterium sp. CGMCC 11546]
MKHDILCNCCRVPSMAAHRCAAMHPFGRERNYDQSCPSSRGFISGEIITIAITTIANNKINGYKTSIARPLIVKLSALRSNPGLSTCIMAAFSGDQYIQILSCSHRNRIVVKTANESSSTQPCDI